jgi:hypothetical protein
MRIIQVFYASVVLFFGSWPWNLALLLVIVAPAHCHWLRRAAFPHNHFSAQSGNQTALKQD